MLLQVPIGFAMIIVGVVGFALQSGWGPAVTLLVNEPTGVLSSADLATVPLFLLMGTFASVAGFSTDIYNAAAAFLGHRRGGFAYATIGGSAAFGVVCGSSTATAAMFARAALPGNARARLFAGIFDRHDRRRWHAQVADPAVDRDDPLLHRLEGVHSRPVPRRDRARDPGDRRQSAGDRADCAFQSGSRRRSASACRWANAGRRSRRPARSSC